MNQSGRNRSLNSGQKLYISKANWYSLRYPGSWRSEEDEDCTTFSDPENGVGALQVSAYETPATKDPKDLLLEYLSDHGISLVEKKLIFQRDDGRSMASYSYTEGPWLKRIWFVSKGNHLLMITYNRKVDHQGMEDQVVDKVVHSVTIEAENSMSSKTH